MLPYDVSRLVKRVTIFTIYHISEFHEIKDLNYRRIGLSIYVEFTLGKSFCARQEIIQKRIQNTKNHAICRVRDKTYYHHLLLESSDIEIPASLKHKAIKNKYLRPVLVCSLTQNVSFCLLSVAFSSV